MKTKSLVLTAILTWGLTGSYLKLHGKEEKIAHVIVICDASRSVTSASASKKGIDQLKQYADSIPGWEIYPFRSDIYFYPVSNNLTSKPLGGRSVCYNIKMQGDLNREKKRVDLLIDNVKKDIDISSVETKNSCILLSISRAINKFYEIKADHPNSDCRYELIIISDLLECCQQPDSDIHMALSNLKKLDGEIQKFTSKHSDIKVNDLDLKVRVIFNTPGMGAELNKLESAWRNWFYSIGIRKENLLFYTDKPSINRNVQLGKP